MSEDTETEKNATLEKPALPTESLDAQVVAVRGAAEKGTGAAASRSDVRAKVAEARAFVSQHKVTTVVFCGFLAFIVVFLVIAFLRTTGVPDEATLTADAQARIAAPTLEGNDLSTDDLLVYESTKVRSVKRSATAVDSAAAQFGASAYASAEVALTWKSSSVKAVTTATLIYAKVNGSWMGTGSPIDAKTSFEATAGINQSGVRANIDEILLKAEDSLAGEKPAATGVTAGAADADTDVDATTLPALYSSASMKIESEDFNAEAQTDTVKLTCKKSSSFVAYECDLTVVFSFKQNSGVWEVDSVTVDNADAAKTPSYSTLLGTWTSAFQSQETEGAKCLAASATPLRVTVTKVEPAKDGSAAKLTAKVDGLAHFHAHPSKDCEASDGDLAFTAQDLTATLAADEDGDEKTLTFSGDLPQQVNGTVSVELSFGSAEDATAVTAKVTSTYKHTGSFLLIPYDETLTYTDTFILGRSAE